MMMFHIRTIAILTILLASISCSKKHLSSDDAIGGAASDEGILRALAELLQPGIAEAESRLLRLQQQIHQLELPVAPPITRELGYRGALGAPAADLPVITLDLLKPHPIDSVYLVPTSLEAGGGPDLLPRRLSLETAMDASFTQPHGIARDAAIEDQTAGISPVHFRCGASARYLRLTVHEGRRFAGSEQFAIAEIVVISAGEPVSFNCPVTASHGLDVPGIWHARALTDGIMPMGIWQDGNEQPNVNPDPCADAGEEPHPADFGLSLEKAAPLDRLIVFPCRAMPDADLCLLPASIDVWLHRDDAEFPPLKLIEWQHPGPGNDHGSPLVLPLAGTVADRLSIVSRPAAVADGRRVHALSEIEIWSGGVNVARGRELSRQVNGSEDRVDSLTDGHGPDGRILPVGEWLERHRKHGQLRREFEQLLPLHREMINRAEVHALWACSVVFGIVAVLPLVIAHQRRMIPKKEIEKIRKRIASDLHDDVGSNLGSISLIARVAKNELEKNGEESAVRRDLDELESIARESSMAMRDIVWLVEQERESVGDLVDRLRDLCGRLLRGIDVCFDCSGCSKASMLSPEAKRNLFLFCKEAFHNILKHARATQVRIRLWDEGDQLALEISDNGVGLPLKDADESGRVGKLTARAEALKAHMRIKSSRESGTRIRLQFRRNPILPKLHLILS